MATIRRVQSVKNTGDNAFSGVCTVTLPKVPTRGNLLFLVLATDKNPVSIAVPTGFAKLQSEEVGANAAGCIAWKVSDGTERTLTCTLGSGIVSKPSMMVFEYDGFTGTPVDVSSKTNSGATNVVSAATSALTTTQPNTTVFTVCIIDSMPPDWGSNRAWSNSFTEIDACGVGSNASMSVAYRQFTSTQVGLTTTHSWSAATDQAVTFAVAFVEDGSTFGGDPTYEDDTATSAELYQRFSTYGASNTTSYTLRLPRQAKIGHLLVAIVGTSSNTIGLASAGWSAVKTNNQATHSSSVLWKIADGTEKDIVFSWTTTGIPTITVLEYSGIRATDVLGAYNRNTATSAVATLSTGPITTTSSKSLVLAINVIDDQATASAYLLSTWSEGFQNVEGNSEGGAGVTGMMIGQRVVTSAGTNVCAKFLNAGSADEMQNYIIEFACADGSAATSTDVEANTVATPTFTPPAGTFTGTQNIVISTATGAATIHYTTDGSGPTTSSPTYSGAVAVSSTTVIKAIAVKSGMVNSAMATGTFTISSGAALVQQAENEATNFQGTITVTLPTPAVAGNLLVFAAGVDKTNTVSSLPSGFSAGVSNLAAAGIVVCYKLAVGGETALTLTLTNAAISKPTAWAAEYSGVPASAVLGLTNNANSGVALVQTINPGSITTSKTFSLVLAFATADSWVSAAWDSGSWTNGFTSIATTGSTTSTAGKAPLAVAGKAFTLGQSASTAFTTTQTADEMAGAILEFATTSDGTATSGGPTNPVLWRQAGNCQATSAEVVLGMTSSGNVSLKVYEMPTETLVATVGPTATTAEGTSHIVNFSITGLTADKQYKYMADDGGGSGVQHSKAGYFYTSPAASTPTSFNFVHYSCNSLPNNARFLDIINKNPKFLICMGDWHYDDINSATESAYHASYTNNLTAVNHSAVLAAFGFVRIWDDHDFSGNDSNSTATGRTASSQVYRKFHAHYDMPDSVAVYHSFVWGRVRFVLMDVRSEKVPSGSPVMISVTQMTWVKAQLLAAKNAGQVVVLGSGTPWIGNGASGDSDSWGNATFGTTQRAELGAYIRSIQMNRSIFIISGDAHMLAWDDGTNNTFGAGGGENFRVFHGAALGRTGSTKGGPYSGGSKASTSGNEGDGQYARVNILDNGGSQIQVNWIGMTTSEAVWQAVSFPLNVPPKAKARALTP